MKNEYDFSNARKNPYVKKLKKQITINLDNDTIDYFKNLSQSTGIPYQTLINLFLADCAKNKKKPTVAWN
ncbi:MAG: BrnA antitoxin family protein [Clostridia bacterium]|nr:BrnA antitoxin family protein [Clostridia bacterium]